MTPFLKYFTVYEDHFWQFESDYDMSYKQENIISIVGGNTIIYMEELMEIIIFLEPQGIPLLGSLLLVIAATNANGEESINKIKSIIDVQDPYFDGHTYVEKAFRFLHKIESLPKKYKSGKNRRLVLQTIFKKCHNILSSEKAKSIIKEYKRYADTLQDRIIKENVSFEIIVKELKVLALLDNKFKDADAIINAIQNLPDDEDISDYLEEEILESDELADKPLDFIEQLVKDERTFQVGSLIKRLWASLQIPFHHNIPSGQPLGGISDLTNKGSFDKLLISEFANDEDLFISRIANNEALYIEREIPPQQDKITRIFLIDISLKNWGTPKILAYAISIAILKHPKNEIDCKFFIIGDTYQEVELNNIDEVINSMNHLSGVLDASVSLDNFFSEYQQTKNTEIFLLTSTDSMKMNTVQKTIAQHRELLSFLVLCDADGYIHLYKYKNQNKKHIQTLALPLEKLWERKINKKPKKILQTNDSSVVPILYPVSYNNSNIFMANGRYYIYNRGSLYKFSSIDLDKGFEFIVSGLGFDYGEFTMLKENNNDILVFWDYDKVELNYYNIQSKIHEKYTVKEQRFYTKIIQLFTHQNRLFIYSNKEIHEVNNIKKDIIGINKERFINDVCHQYIKALSNIKDAIKKQKAKYDVVCNLTKINLDSEYSIVINDFYLSQTGFYKINKQVKNTTNFDENVNLILKEEGLKKIEIIRIMKEHTELSLNEVHKFIGTYRPVILKDVDYRKAEKLKNELESKGAICYTTNTSFEFKEGSKIIMDNGILIFKSSDDKIPVFYIPFIIGKNIAFATEHEFAGDEYFLPEENKLTNIEVNDFFKKYINPFLDNIHNVTKA